jgi:thiopeptide-type bacteriocin biosynthesis protein
LKPLIEELEKKGYLKKYFYIIYWQGGNHIRFRYLTENEKEVKGRLLSCFNEFKQIYEPTEVMDEATYYKLFANNKEEVKELRWIEDGKILEASYEPEYIRYGGRMAIDYSENVFQCSSSYALDILEEVKNNYGLKLFAALDMMGMALNNIDPKEDFLKQYDNFWRDFNEQKEEPESKIEELFEKYKHYYERTRERNSEFYSAWKEQLCKNLDEAVRVQDTFDNEWQAKNLILASLLHMNHNRLGIYPRYESIMARIMLLHIKEALV